VRAKGTYLILLALLLLTACGTTAETPTETQEPVELEAPVEAVAPIEIETPTEERPVQEADPREETIDALLENMTLEEKVGQVFLVRCPETEVPEKISQYHLGGVLLFTRDFKSEGDWLTKEQFLEKMTSYQDAADLPLLIAVDEEGGTVARASRDPYLFSEKAQSPQQLYAQGGMEKIAADALEKNQRLKELGINVNLSPVADVSTDSADFIYDRSFGQDATATSEYVVTVVEQMEKAGVGSALKHFPGYGGNVDTHTDVAIDDRPLETFWQSDFLPFQAGIQAGADAVLVSHNLVTALDDALPASLSPAVHELLREDLDFSGVIMTDDLAMDALAEYGDAAVLALAAGNDLLITTDFETQIPQVLEALADGTLDEDTLDQAVRNVLGWKYDLGLLTEKEDAT
jgi:beta-N-acetylhexosaminidase